MQERRDAGQVGCGMPETLTQDWSDSGLDGYRKEEYRTGVIQDWRNTGKEEYGKTVFRTGRMRNRRDARQEGCRKGGMQDRWDAGRT